MIKGHVVVIVVLVVLCIYLLYFPPFCSQHEANEQQTSRIIVHHPLSKFQVMHTQDDLELYIYSAIFDDRFNKSVLRIFGLEKKEGVEEEFSCRWFSQQSSSTDHIIHESRATRFWIDTSWPHWSSHFACEYACSVPKYFREDTVQLTSHAHTFKVRVEYVQSFQDRKTLAVCLKPQTSIVNPKRLVEWFEMLQVVGIPDVIAYTTDVTGSSRYVLQYYAEKGLLTLIPFPYLWSLLLELEERFPKMTGQQRYAVYQQIYLIAMHDCLYRFSNLYKYILFLDTDEIITPIDPEENVMTMLSRAEQKYPSAAGFLFFTSYHWEEAEEKKDTFLYMQKYSKASPPIDTPSKSALSTSRAITMNFNEVLDVPSRQFSSVLLEWKEFAYIHHYRGQCKETFEPLICRDMIRDATHDTVITKYNDRVEGNVRFVLNQLHLG